MIIRPRNISEEYLALLEAFPCRLQVSPPSIHLSFIRDFAFLSKRRGTFDRSQPVLLTTCLTKDFICQQFKKHENPVKQEITLDYPIH